MGFFNRRKTSSIADDIYKQEYEKERVNQAAIRGKADAAKYGGKSRMAGMISGLADNFAANTKSKEKSGWGLPSSDTIGGNFGSFDPSGGKRGGSTHSDYWGGWGEEKRAPRKRRKVVRVVRRARRHRPTFRGRSGGERVIILR